MAKPVKCSRCGRENDPSFTYCLDCGQSIRAAPPTPAERSCASCGSPLASGFRFCGRCGQPVAEPPPAPGPAFRPTPHTVPGPIPCPGPLPGMAVPGEPRLARPAARARQDERPPVPATPARPPAPVAGPRLSLIRHDGQPGAVFPLAGKTLTCGRATGEALLPDDSTVSPRHAQFSVQGGRVTVEDLGSLSGTFLRLRAPHALMLGDEIRVGRQLLRLEPFPRAAPAPSGPATWGSPDQGYAQRLSQLLDGGGVGEIFPLKAGENLIGRESGDITFPFDRYVSGRHAHIEVADGRLTLADLGSSNGTFLRLGQPAVLQSGDQLLIGLQLMRFDA